MDKFYFPYDAMRSWAGYDIQGKMTIYFVLKEIRDALRKDHVKSMFELRKYISIISIELENLEDIAVLKDNDYYQVFQVKSGKDTKLKSADCYNLYMVAYMMKEKNKQNGQEYSKNQEPGKAYLISLHNLDSESKIYTQGKTHITSLIETDFEDDINKDKLSELKYTQKKASFQSLIRKFGIMDFPKEERRQKVESDIIKPLSMVLDAWDNLDVKLYNNDALKNADTIKDNCILLIQEIKNNLVNACPDSRETTNLTEKEDEHVYWALVNYLDDQLFYKKKEEDKPGVRINLENFFNEMCKTIDVSIDYVTYLSHILIDKLHYELNEVPQYFREKDISDCPEETRSCISCKNSEDCSFLQKVKHIVKMDSVELLKLFSRLFLNENSDRFNLNNLPKDDDIQSVVYKNIGKYHSISYENGIPEIQKARMIAEMSNADTPSRIAQKISQMSKKDIKFIEKLFESSFLFHMHDEGANPGFHYGSNEKFTDIISDDLSPDQKRRLKFLENENNQDFVKPAIIKVIGLKEAEELIDGESST